MPAKASQKIQLESRKVRRLIADYLRLHRAKRPSAAREHLLHKKIREALAYLDQNAIHDGDSKAHVERLLGPAPGHAGADSWLYPGGSDDESYRVDFEADAVVRKSFDTIYAG